MPDFAAYARDLSKRFDRLQPSAQHTLFSDAAAGHAHCLGQPSIPHLYLVWMSVQGVNVGENLAEGMVGLLQRVVALL